MLEVSERRTEDNFVDVHGNTMKKKRKAIRRQKKRTVVGIAPLAGYTDLAREEIEELKRLTMKDAIIQTEILLKAARWMK